MLHTRGSLTFCCGMFPSKFSHPFVNGFFSSFTYQLCLHVRSGEMLRAACWVRGAEGRVFRLRCRLGCHRGRRRGTGLEETRRSQVMTPPPWGREEPASRLLHGGSPDRAAARPPQLRAHQEQLLPNTGWVRGAADGA